MLGRHTRRLFKLGCRAACRAYLRLWHRFEAQGLEHVPPHGPGLALTNHASLLDIPALIAVDHLEDGTMLAKASLFKVPLVRQVLDAWGAIPVERKGRDLAGIRALMAALRQGRMVAVAAEGRRTRSGRLEPIHPVLARIALNANVPLVPIGIAGSFAALPPGAVFPRPRKILLRVGEPFRLPPGTSEEEAARRIRDAIAALLPPEQRPLEAGLGPEGRPSDGHEGAPRP
jgi:1-acyl-sn-glycerol-3-phosphate acyltransferase